MDTNQNHKSLSYEEALQSFSDSIEDKNIQGYDQNLIAEDQKVSPVKENNEETLKIPNDIIDDQYQINFNFQRSPIELTSNSSENTCVNNYFKGCKWAPDGSCLMTNSEDKTLRVYNLPRKIWDHELDINDSIVASIRLKNVDSIFDYCWNPSMNSWNPQTCYLASTCRNSPIHLWNVSSGKLINTFKSYTANEELQTAYSLAFSPDGKTLYAGLNKAIHIYNVESTFSQYQKVSTHNKLFPGRGQHGIISCFGISHFHPNLFAAGAYSNSIGIYAKTNNALISLLHGSQGGITHLIFSADGTKLFSGGRKDPYITCWDLRNMGKVCQTFDRPVTNNQRIYFDIDRDSRYLASGSMDGHVTLWDLDRALDKSPSDHPPKDRSETDHYDPYSVLKFKAHVDTVNGINFHPILPILATVSGRRHITCHSLKEQSSSPSTEDENSTDDNENGAFQSENESKKFESNNCIKIWWLGKR